MRQAGILMPVSSLPNKYGIGDFGPESYQFVDLIAQCGFKLWQLLPLNPVGYGNSPYQTYSSCALDEIYISLDMLYADGLISKPESFNQLSEKVHYAEVREFKQKYLKEAFSNFKADDKYIEFAKQQWVQYFAMFMKLKKKNNMQCWVDWELADKEWIKNSKADGWQNDAAVQYEIFIQYQLIQQWYKLQEYCNRKDIKTMGDIPIYVGIDSDDVWTNQNQFLLDKDGHPRFIAGVPPDAFSDEGQRWGNPIYDWDKMQEDGFSWWLKRLNYNSKLFDIIRIDHFRAFDTYWKIPASCPTAVTGEWVEAPGYALFDQIYKTYPKIDIVVEDLGDLRPEVLQLRDHYNLMGMRILQHTFYNSDVKDDPQNMIIYTGTHDNNTIHEWYHNICDEDGKKYIAHYLSERGYNQENMTVNIIDYLFSSNCDLAIAPLFDLLDLDDNYRVNAPGTVGDPNWQWKIVNYQGLIDRISWLQHTISQSHR